MLQGVGVNFLNLINKLQLQYLLICNVYQHSIKLLSAFLIACHLLYCCCFSYMHNLDSQIRVMATIQLVKENVFQINWNMFDFCIHDEIMYPILEL